MDALRPFAIPPGDYMVPRCNSMEEMKSPEFAEKLARGPVFMVSIWPNGMMSMGRALGLWFLYCLAVSIVTGYTVGLVVPSPAPGHRLVFHLASAIAFMGYAAALWQMTIWYRRDLAVTVKSTIDGLVYSLLTAAVFAYVWAIVWQQTEPTGRGDAPISCHGPD
ncbi:MAG: hypothetical protein WDN04_16550 [Rhodospirillales bacterium]